MLFVILLILLSAGYSLLYSLIPLSIWYLFLWIPLGIISGALTLVLLVLLYLLVASKTKCTNSLKHIVLRNVVWLVFKVFHIKLDIVGKENIPNGTFVIYGNHKSNMDPLILYYAMHVKCTAIGKKSLFVHPIMKLVAKTFGAIAIDRENDREAAKSIVQGIKLVKNGVPIIIFPEGGIKSRETDEMVNLRAGAYKLAVKSEAPILPCSIIGASKISETKRRKKKIIRVIFHKPIYKEEYAGKNTTEIGQEVEKIINDGIKNGC